MIEVLELRGDLPSGGERATGVLEADGLVVLPDRPFVLSAAERTMLDPAILKPGSKNVSLDPGTGQVGGVAADAPAREVLAPMLARFAQAADALLEQLTPNYVTALQRKRTSFRPGAVETRALSPRKDDRRLHVDAFPASPVQGRRILRVFANVNPSGEGRVWEIGEDGFEATARRFAPKLTGRGRTAGLKAALGLTRGRQTAYDQTMLQLHDGAKLDDDYQRQASKRRIVFAPESFWVVYTDGVMHAALSGQHAFEQTYLLPVEAMNSPQLSPLRALERVTGRRLV